MKLIIIILALLIGRFFSGFINYRRFSWFTKHVRWMEQHTSEYGIWNSPLGAVLVLIFPALVFLFLMHSLNNLADVFGLVFSLIIVFLCLDHESLTDHIEDYIRGTNIGDENKRQLMAGLIDPRYDSVMPDKVELLGSIFNQGNKRIFAVLFWFIVLGPLGALIYRLSFELYGQERVKEDGFAESARDLHQLLSWPAARLTLIAYALVGSLVHTFESWRQYESGLPDDNDELLANAGLAAIQYSDGNEEIREVDWLDEAHGLINRSLLLWLAVIAFSTISGWLA